jgi:hypothetical protein
VQQPTPRTAQTPTPFLVDGATVPRTAEEVRALRIKLDDLREELQDAASRRGNIAGQLRTMDNRAARGVEDRLAVLDARIVQIEKAITANGALLQQAPAAALTAGTTMDPDPAAIAERVVDDIVPIVAIVSVFVFAPFAIAVSRFIWKRATNAPIRSGATDQATQQRLEQLQQSVDTIAIEVERISEGQRFVTRLLSDKERAALSGGAAEPVRMPMKSAIPSERG